MAWRSWRKWRTTIALLGVAGIMAGAMSTGAALAAPAATTSPLTISAPICPGYSGLDSVNPYAQVLTGTFTPGWLPAVTVRSGTTVNWTYNPYSNTSWQSWFYSLKWLGALVRAAEGGYISAGPGHVRIAGADERWAALNLALGITRDFMVKHPTVTSAPNFVEISSMAHRGQLLACLAEALGPASTPAWLVAAARAHAAYLANPAHYLGANNRGVDQDLGVLTTGCTVGPVSYEGTAMTRLTTTLKTLVGSDGVPTEQAPGYVQYVYELFAAVAKTAGRCGIAGTSVFTSRIAGIPGFLTQATQPDGNLVQLGDTASAPPARLPGMDYVLTLGASGTRPAQRVAIYGVSGFIFGRSAWTPMTTASFYSLRYGPPVLQHGNYDRTSITWMVNGRDRLVDSGHYGYANATLHKALVAPEAHNLLTMDPVSGISLANQPTSLLSHALTTGADSFLFAARPYSWMYGTTKRFVTDRRAVLVARGPDLLVVTDSAAGAPSAVQWRQRWHLPAGWTAHVKSSICVSATNGTDSMTLIRIPLGGSLPTARLVSSVQAPGLNVLKSNVDVQFGLVGRSSSQVTVIVPVAASQVSVTRSGGILTILIGGTQRVVVAMNADGSLTRLS